MANHITGHGIIKRHDEWVDSVEVFSDSLDKTVTVFVLNQDEGITVHLTQVPQLIKALQEALVTLDMAGDETDGD